MTAPKHLSAAAKGHVKRLQGEYDFSADQWLILIEGLEGWDMANQARELLRREGLVVNGRRHPACEIQKQGTAVFLRCMRELELNRGEPGDPGRPPTDVEL